MTRLAPPNSLTPGESALLDDLATELRLVLLTAAQKRRPADDVLARRATECLASAVAGYDLARRRRGLADLPGGWAAWQSTIVVRAARKLRAAPRVAPATLRLLMDWCDL